MHRFVTTKASISSFPSVHMVLLSLRSFVHTLSTDRDTNIPSYSRVHTDSSTCMTPIGFISLFILSIVSSTICPSDKAREFPGRNSLHEHLVQLLQRPVLILWDAKEDKSKYDDSKSTVHKPNLRRDICRVWVNKVGKNSRPHCCFSPSCEYRDGLSLGSQSSRCRLRNHHGCRPSES